MHSPTKPVLIFVSSRRQTRLTALDLITCAGVGLWLGTCCTCRQGDSTRFDTCFLEKTRCQAQQAHTHLVCGHAHTHTLTCVFITIRLCICTHAHSDCVLMRTVGNDRPQQWVHMDEEELEEVCASVKDAALKHTLQFGIGLHHAGLNDRDRTLVETLFVEGAIQVCAALVCLCVCVCCTPLVSAACGGRRPGACDYT